ncbi:sodium:calcium antiporter [Candidatus Woesearchaeota archaeon]|nr:MAG: sodium:calcium antiporter [Candidatus Woesearchaeota archaeon]
MFLALALYLLLLAFGLFLLIKSSDIFTTKAERIGLRLGMSPFLVGLIIVGLGTSLPELASSLVAAATHQTGIVIGNVLGSNITNILFVLGLAALMTKNISLKWNVMHVDIPLLIGSAILATISLLDGVFSRTEAALSLAGYVVYIFYALSKRAKIYTETVPSTKEKTVDWLILALTIAGIYAGAKVSVFSLTLLATTLQAPEGLVAISLLAIGTSLPEVSVTLHAARRGKADLAVGNVLGSNIFNTFLVLGLPGMITPLTSSPTTLAIGLIFFISATLLFTFIAQDKEITLWDGFILLFIFILFLTKLGTILIP